MQERIYLDNITTCRPSKAAVAAMMPFFEEAFGSITQPHQMGQELFSDLEKSYRAIYTLFQAKEQDTFVFTSSGAEAASQVIHSVYKDVVRKTGKNHFVASSLEEAATIYAITKLEDEGCTLNLAKASTSGYVTADSIAEAITPRTCLISLPLASGLTGVIQPLSDIAKLCKQRAILLHVDVTHASGKLNIELDELEANFITFNGEQLHAPKGTGGLFVRSANIHALISGEKEEVYYRGGTLNVPLLVGLGQAAIEAEQNKNLYGTEVARLRDKLEQGICSLYPEATILFHDQERLPHITAISFPAIRNEALLFALNQKNIFASMGGGQLQSIELILQACGLEKSIAQCALSFSLSKDTTETSIDRAIEIITDAAKRLRRLSKGLV
jgi:cysteine desulfurase